MASLDAYAAKHMTPPTVTTKAMWGFANGFERVVDAVMQGGGTYVRSLGEDAVTMAIVSHLYRYDSVQHDTG